MSTVSVSVHANLKDSTRSAPGVTTDGSDAFDGDTQFTEIAEISYHTP